ncbi:Ribulokinase [subsurface metagenome]
MGGKNIATNPPFIIGIDCGTESLRTGIFNLNGEIVATSAYSYKTYFPKPGWAEQRPEDWWDSLRYTVQECLKKAKIEIKEIKGICIDGTSSTVLPVDIKGTPLRNAILWMDVRASEESNIIEKVGHPVLRYSGGRDSEEWMVPKALWLKRNQPSIYNKAFKIIESADWLSYKLTGLWTASRYTATSKWNYVSPMGGWLPEFFNEIELEDILEKWPSKVLDVGACIGALTRQAADELGLNPGIPVVQGATDAGVAILGTNVTEPGEVTLIIGSSSVHFTHSEKPLFSPGIWGPYPEPLFKDMWLIEGGQVSTGSLINWFVKNFCSEERQQGKKSGISPYSILDEKSKGIPIGSEGLIALDFFQGNRTPYRDPTAKGVLLGLTLKHSKIHIYKSLLESVAFGTRNVLETFQKMGIVVKKICVCGGGGKSRYWLQIHSDICGKPLYVVEMLDASLLGSAISASVGAGLYSSLKEASSKMVKIKEEIEPDKANYEKYSFFYNKYKELYQMTNEIMHDLSQKRN